MIPVVDEISLGAKLLGFSKKVWPYLIAAGLVVATIGMAVVAHKHAVKATFQSGYQKGVSDTQAAQRAAQEKADTQAQQINSNLRSKSDAETRIIYRNDGATRMRGPGKATCPGTAAAPSSAGRYVAPAGPGPAAVAELPDYGGQRLIALPFDDTVTVISQCALDRAEALKWRQSDQQQRAAAEASQTQEQPK